MLSDRDGEEQTVVFTAVQGSGNRVYVHFLAELEGLSCERKLVDIYLCTQSAVTHKPLDCVREASCDKISV